MNSHFFLACGALLTLTACAIARPERSLLPSEPPSSFGISGIEAHIGDDVFTCTKDARNRQIFSAKNYGTSDQQQTQILVDQRGGNRVILQVGPGFVRAGFKKVSGKLLIGEGGGIVTNSLAHDVFNQATGVEQKCASILQGNKPQGLTDLHFLSGEQQIRIGLARNMMTYYAVTYTGQSTKKPKRSLRDRANAGNSAWQATTL